MEDKKGTIPFRSRYGLLLLISIIVALVSVVFVSSSKLQSLKTTSDKVGAETASTTPTPPSKQQTEAKIKDLTGQLLALKKQYDNAGAENKATLGGSLFNVAQTRKTALVSAIKNYPDIILNNAINQNDRAQLPENIQTLVEQEISTDGLLKTGYYDDFEGKKSTPFFFLQSNEATYDLHFANKNPSFDKMHTGAKVKVKGVALEGQIALSSDQNQPYSYQIESAAPALAPVIGTKKLAVLMVNFAADPSYMPYTQDDVRTYLFTHPFSMKANYLVSSYNQLTISGKINPDGDIFGYYTISDIYTDCQFSSWAAHAKAAAQSQGVDLSGYDNIMYVLSHTGPGCGWTGLATMPGTETWVNTVIAFNQPRFYTFDRIATHELSHNFGLNHSNNYYCYGANNEQVALSNNCISQEYGDSFDLMGDEGAGMMFHSAFHKRRLGFINDSNVFNVTQSGTYTVDAIEGSSSSGIKMLRFPFDYDANGHLRDYYIDYRNTPGYYNYQSPVEWVFVRVAPDDYSLYDPPNLLYSSLGVSNIPLIVGMPLNDTLHNITIEAVNISSASATIRVTLPSIPPATPTPTATPTPYYTPTPLPSPTPAYPRIVFTYPSNGQTLPNQRSITVTAQANDPVGISQLKIFINNNQVASCSSRKKVTTLSCSYNWRIASIPAGSYTLNASALNLNNIGRSTLISVTKP